MEAKLVSGMMEVVNQKDLSKSLIMCGTLVKVGKDCSCKNLQWSLNNWLMVVGHHSIPWWGMVITCLDLKIHGILLSEE